LNSACKYDDLFAIFIKTLSLLWSYNTPKEIEMLNVKPNADEQAHSTGESTHTHTHILTTYIQYRVGREEKELN